MQESSITDHHTHNVKNIYADFIMSVGRTCRPAEQIKRNGLRQYAAPLDWVGDYDLNAVLHLFRTGFTDFFKDCRFDPDEPPSGHLAVRDNNTNMISAHHFPLDKSISEGYAIFYPMMYKRYLRALKLLKSSRHVILVSDRGQDFIAYERFLHEFAKLFSCRFTFLNIRHSETERTRTEHVITPRLKIIEYSFDDTHPDKSSDNKDAWLGNCAGWSVAFAPVRLSFYAKLKRFFMR